MANENANNSIVIESPGVTDSTKRPVPKHWPPRVNDPNTYDPNVFKSGDVTNGNLHGKPDPVIMSLQHDSGEIHHVAVPAGMENHPDVRNALAAGGYA